MEKSQIFQLLIAVIAVSLLAFGKLVKKCRLKKTPTSDDTSSPPSTSTITPPSIFVSQLGGEYEVFLSFSGKDTRKTFTDYLYNDLVEAGIRTFRDDNELPVGEQIGPELLKAIENSKIYIPIFSRSYASSKWCLSELAHMVRHTTEGRKIFPIFYDVEPVHVRHQMGSYEEAFRQHEYEPSFDEKIFQEWKNALTVVGKLKGLELKKETNGYEGKLVKMVVEKILSELKKIYTDLPDNLVGMDHHVKEMKELLDLTSNGVRIVGIYGMGGIGKTTIAKVIYNQLCECFECCCFLEDVRETLKQHNGLVNLKNEFISKIGKGKDSNIKDLVRRKKVLIVLDDIDEESQFDCIPGKWDLYGSGSKIIVTTRNKEVLDYLKMSYQRNDVPHVYRSYETQLMNLGDSLQLFSKHAFSRDSPPKDYDILSNEVVSMAAGLPLVLVTIGSLLFAKVDKALWEETIKKLKKIPHKNVVEKLRISFDSLEYEQKQIFLDIACFFVGEDIRYLSYMWDDCDFYPKIGIDVLVRKSLIKFGDDYKIWMHDQIKDLGRQIVREENVNELGERSRLWNYVDALDVVESRTGTRKVVAMNLQNEWKGLNYPPRCLIEEDFKELRNLRYLKVDCVDFAGDFKHLLSKLRWLEFSANFKENSSPPNLHLKNLIVLQLSDYIIKDDWEGWSQIKVATKLKVLNLSYCNLLTRASHISTFENLERLILTNCSGLNEIDPSIGNLTKLKVIHLSNCWSLSRANCSTFVALESLDIHSCESLHRLDGLEELKLLTYLNISGCILEILADLSNLKKLKTLVIRGCYNLIEIQGLDGLKSLKYMDMSDCTSIEILPDWSGLKDLEEIRVSGCEKVTEIRRLEELKSLRILRIDGCKSIKKLSDLSGLEKLKEIIAYDCLELSEIRRFEELKSLERLDIHGCESIETLPDLSGLQNLKELNVSNCVKLSEIRGLEELKSLDTLDIEGCKSIERLPDLSGLQNLKEIRAPDCVKLFEIAGLGELKSLEWLDINECVSIEKLPDLSGLEYLKRIRVNGCVKITAIPGLEELKSLQELDISECESIEKLPDLSDLQNLKDIRAFGCVKLSGIRGLEKLKSLKSLGIERCKSIEKLPDLSNFINLYGLRVAGCMKLTEIPGLEELKSLKQLNIEGCKSIEKLPELSNLINLCGLRASGCVKITEIPGLEELKSLKLLNIEGCKSIKKLPDLSNLINLYELRADGCVKLTKIPGLEELKSLKLLNIEGCKSIEKLPDLSNLINLEELRADGCVKLTEIPGLEELKSLKLFSIEGCKSIEKLPDLSNLNLELLNVSGCVKLTEILGLEELEFLECLYIEGCKSIEKLPDLSKLSYVRTLNVSACVKLTEIPGLEELVSLELLNIEGSKSIGNLPALSNLRYLEELIGAGSGKLRNIQRWEFFENLSVFDKHKHKEDRLIRDQLRYY